MWLFSIIEHKDYETGLKKIEQCFQFSMMTVLVEDNFKKYHYLEFVEFLDMLCRICIVCVNKKETLDYKLHFLLGLIYERMFNEGHMVRLNWKLYPVDE